MAVVHEFKYTVAPDGVWITLNDWIATLPEDQQTEFHSAEARQIAIRSQVIEQGTLALARSATNTRGTIDYVWKDEAAAQQNKPRDPIWYQYFDRYLKENNITFEIIERKI